MNRRCLQFGVRVLSFCLSFGGTRATERGQELATRSLDTRDSSAAADRIPETCSESDQFTFSDIGTAVDWNSVGVAKGTAIADSTAITTSDGKIRMYFSVSGQGLVSAISDNGVTFTAEGVRITEGKAGHPKITKLSDGRLRLYTGLDVNPNGGQPGIISYVSSDGLTFTQESGVRISETAAGMDLMSHLTVAPISSGGYRGYFSNLLTPQSLFNDRIVKSATSADLLAWNVDAGVRVGTGATTLSTCSGSQPHALVRANGCVSLFYWRALCGGQPAPGGAAIMYSTARDGVTFSIEYALGVTGAGPDIVKRADGTYLLYYDVGTKDSGFSIRVGTIELFRPFVRGRNGVDLNGDLAGDALLYNITTGATSLEVSTASGGFSRTLSSWDPAWQVYPADLNGDGLADFFLHNADRGSWVQAMTQKGGPASYTSGSWDTNWTIYPADLDGDGRTDIFLYNFLTGVWFQCLSDGKGGFDQYFSGQWDPRWECYLADMNGDGRGDVVVYNRTSGAWVQALSRAAGFEYSASGTWDAGWRIYPADLTGEGRIDLFLMKATGERAAVLSRAAGGFDSVAGSRWDAGWAVYPADLDGNGKVDLLLYNRTSGAWVEAFSDGTGNFGSYASGQWDPRWELYATDLNADGRDDLLLYRGDGTWVEAFYVSPGAFTYSSGTWGTGWTIFTRR